MKLASIDIVLIVIIQRLSWAVLDGQLKSGNVSAGQSRQFPPADRDG